MPPPICYPGNARCILHACPSRDHEYILAEEFWLALLLTGGLMNTGQP